MANSYTAILQLLNRENFAVPLPVADTDPVLRAAIKADMKLAHLRVTSDSPLDAALSWNLEFIQKIKEKILSAGSSPHAKNNLQLLTEKSAPREEEAVSLQTQLSAWRQDLEETIHQFSAELHGLFTEAAALAVPEAITEFIHGKAMEQIKEAAKSTASLASSVRSVRSSQETLTEALSSLVSMAIELVPNEQVKISLARENAENRPS